MSENKSSSEVPVVRAELAATKTTLAELARQIIEGALAHVTTKAEQGTEVRLKVRFTIAQRHVTQYDLWEKMRCEAPSLGLVLLGQVGEVYTFAARRKAKVR